MQKSQFTKCSSCGTLQDLYDRIGCSIYQLIKSKWIGVTYNTDNYFDCDHYRTLLRLQRIIYKRLYNQKYPTDCYTNDDIITLASKSLYKFEDCRPCPCEDFTNFITSSTTSTTTLAPPPLCYNYTVTAMGTSAEPIVFYTDCSGTPQEVVLQDNEVRTVCAEEGSVNGDNISIIKGGLCQ